VSPVMQPVTFFDTLQGFYGTDRFQKAGPSKWDLEAVNAQVVSPFIALEFPAVGGMSVMYSQGMYEQPIIRQGKVGKQLGNLTLTAYVNYTLRKSRTGGVAGLDMKEIFKSN